MTKRKTSPRTRRSSDTKVLWIDPKVKKQLELYVALSDSSSMGKAASEILSSHLSEVLPGLLAKAA